MFSRNFMKMFSVRKYQLPTAKTGSVTSDKWLTNQRANIVGRPILYISITGILLLAFSDFHTGDEMIGQVARPVARTFYENWIPENVRSVNESIIEQFELLQKMNDLNASFSAGK